MSDAVRELQVRDLLDELDGALDTLRQRAASKGNGVLTPLEHSVIEAALLYAADFIGEQDEREKRSR